MKGKIIFFGTLVLLLFVGEGKRSVVDMVGMAGTLALSVGVLLTQKLRFPSGSIIFWWAGLLMYLIIRLPYSDSVAYSLYATTRFFIAFIMFVIFANGSIAIRTFSRGVISFAVFALASSLVVFLVPSVLVWMPEMSLLSNAYGHHHVAYLLIFAIPFATQGFLAKKSWAHLLVTAIFFVSLLLTRARGAWLIVAIYIVYVLFQKNIIIRSRFRMVGAGLSVIFLIFFTATSLSPELFQSPLFGAQRVIKSGFTSARLTYWKQGFRAFSEQPVFGTGLGTFYLSSLRYQPQPNSYSWFAHSFPVQMAAETGIVGAIWVMGVMWAIGRHIKRGLTGEKQALVEAVALSALYSVYEINFDYLIIWMLIWSALGLLVSQNKESSPVARWLFYGSLGFVGLLYIVFVGTEAIQLITKNKVFLQPHNTERTLAYLDSRSDDAPLSQKQLDAVLWFHRKNPEVLAAAGLFDRAIIQDPQRVEYFAEHITFLLKQDDKAGAARALSVDANLSPLLTKELFADVGRPSNKNEYLAKTYYFLGLSVLDESPEQALKLLIMARDQAPEWGYFSAELASLYYRLFSDEPMARRVLVNCQIDHYARELCRSTLEHIDQFSEIGMYKKEIVEIW